MSGKKEKSKQLLEAVSGYQRVVVVVHDNPDPDAIAAGWAVCRLLEVKQNRRPRLVGSGAVVRAENKELIRKLRPPLELVEQLRLRKNTAVVLVDCSPEATHHLLNGRTAELVGVIDHHRKAGRSTLPFVDVRPKVAAAASIAAGYLREQGIEPDERLATALVYGIRTETAGSETYYSSLDRSVLVWLSRFSNPTWLAEIENAPLAREYFVDLVAAIERTFLYDDAAMCVLPRVQGSETIGELADLLIRCEGISRVLCVAVVNGEVLVSARTQRPGDSATDVLMQTLEGIGHGGGHLHRAGGKLTQKVGDKLPRSLEEELRQRWLKSCGVQSQRGVRLVPPREILEHL